MTTDESHDFSGLGVFLTGATSGIGHEAASRFLAAGGPSSASGGGRRSWRRWWANSARAACRWWPTWPMLERSAP